MTFAGAIIKEQGIIFGIVLVKSYVLNSSNKDSYRKEMGLIMKIPPDRIVLASEVGKNLKYYGRQDIVKFLSKINPLRIPWKKFTTKS